MMKMMALVAAMVVAAMMGCGKSEDKGIAKKVESTTGKTVESKAGETTRFWQGVEQYVLENGVDFAHFKFVHKTPIVPVFTTNLKLPPPVVFDLPIFTSLGATSQAAASAALATFLLHSSA